MSNKKYKKGFASRQLCIIEKYNCQVINTNQALEIIKTKLDKTEQTNALYFYLTKNDELSLLPKLNEGCAFSIKKIDNIIREKVDLMDSDVFEKKIIEMLFDYFFLLSFQEKIFLGDYTLAKSKKITSFINMKLPYSSAFLGIKYHLCNFTKTSNLELSPLGPTLYM